MSIIERIIYLLMLGLCLSGCSSQVIQGHSAGKEEIVVFAAASLTEVLEEVKIAYEQEHQNVVITYNFAGSQMLANQIIEGAEPDMFFSANQTYVDKVLESDRSKEILGYDELERDTFASNALVILYSSDYAYENLDHMIESLKKDKRPSVILAHENVPVGSYTMAMLDSYLKETGDAEGYENFFEQVVSYESDVKSVATKLRIHEGDIGIVYRTDAFAVNLEENDLAYVEVEDIYKLKASYGALLLTEEPAAGMFYDFVVHGQGQHILKDAGFGNSSE